MQFDLDNPKNSLQYQLYKVQLVLEQLASRLVPVLTDAIKSFVASVTPYVDFMREYQRLQELGAKANPKIAYLAYHAKTQRARIKNLKRLYKIGCLIEKRGDPHNHQTTA